MGLKCAQVRSSSIDDVQSDHNWFDNVCRAHESINTYVWSCGKYCDNVQGSLTKIELDQYGLRIIERLILLFVIN
jgi:hypothetical protein